MAEEHNSFRYQLIEKAGFLLTTDGSVDDRVQPEDVKNYQVPPPATIDPLSTNPVTKQTCGKWMLWNANHEIDEKIEFGKEENMILVGTESEDTTQNNNGEYGWVFNYLAVLDIY